MRAEGLIAATLLVAMLATSARFALAWGPTGHRVVAELAERQLGPETRGEVHVLLARAGARSLADVANRADELRNDPRAHAEWRATAKLHFVNFADAGCRYVARRDCPGGRCVVAAIERQAARVGDRRLPDAERARALAMLVHLVADVHQPLHAGHRADAGGNRHQVRHGRRGTNLHAIWDTPVLAERGAGWRRYADRLSREPLPPVRGDAASWAEESCRASRDDGIYPPRRRIDAAYLARMRPLAERRLREAAARLASLLEAVLKPVPRPRRLAE